HRRSHQDRQADPRDSSDRASDAVPAPVGRGPAWPLSRRRWRASSAVSHRARTPLAMVLTPEVDDIEALGEKGLAFRWWPRTRPRVQAAASSTGLRTTFAC